MQASCRLGKLITIWCVVAGCTILATFASPIARSTILHNLNTALASLGIRRSETTHQFHHRDPKIGATLISPDNSDLYVQSTLEVIFIGTLNDEKIPHLRQYFSKKKYHSDQQIGVVFVPTKTAKINLAEVKSLLGLRPDLKLRLYQDERAAWHRRWNAFFTPRRYILVGGKLLYVEQPNDAGGCGCGGAGGEAK